ncbi:MAG: esterase, partial [Bacteroidales bacterium]|nr:esterase [Bacteroidales bacterium]
MKKIVFTIGLMFMVISASAQQALFGAAQVVSPQINENGTVTF